MMSGATGIPPADYAALFDTVYVSLYKYFGAPFGAILAGTAEFTDGLYHDRRMFGGGLASANFAAALALQGIDGFEERFNRAMTRANILFDKINALEGITVKPFEHGSNIFPLSWNQILMVHVSLRCLRSIRYLYPRQRAITPDVSC